MPNTDPHHGSRPAVEQLPLVIDGSPLLFEQVEQVARFARPVTLAAGSRELLDSVRRYVDDAARRPHPIYGLNTGFGSLSRRRIEPQAVREVQRNLIRSHAAGVGEALPTEVVRAMMLILAASLARGHSGVRPQLVEHLLNLLNRHVTPVIPCRGSVGASGDLAPLAHLALVLIGEGHATIAAHPDGESISVLPGGEALRLVGLAPLTLEAKEGLALINGTHLMTAVGALVLADVERLFNAAMGAVALAIDACRATDAFLDDRLHVARRQRGQRAVAARLRDMLLGSAILESHRVDDPRVQDPYCLRAAPVVLGAVLDTIEHVRSIFTRELAAVTDNPLIFSETSSPAAFVSGGNFHGMPLAIALDTLKIALCHLAGIAERRINWLLTASDSENPVNIYLSPQPGLHSGLMIAQYTAAACCNELMTLSFPASVGNIPTSAGIEDYNSMGATSARQARTAVELTTQVIAIELLVMTEAMEYQRPLRSGAGVEQVYETVRALVPRLTADRPPSPDIAAIAGLIREGSFAASHR